MPEKINKMPEFYMIFARKILLIFRTIFLSSLHTSCSISQKCNQYKIQFKYNQQKCIY